MTRDWSNTPSNAGLTEETRSQMRSLESAVATSIGARHEAYSKSYTDFTNGLASLFTLQPGEAILSAWATITTTFTDSILTPANLAVVPSAAPTYGNNVLSQAWATAASAKDPSNSFYEDAIANGAVTTVSAAAAVTLGIYDDSGSHVVCSNLTAGACVVHALICTT